MIRKILHTLYVIYAVVLFVVGLLIIFPGVLFAILLGNPGGGNLVIKLCRAWSDCWLFVIGIRNRSIILEPIDPNRHYVFVANHTSYLDIPIIFQSIRKNSFRVLGKSEMSKIPVFGTLYKLAVVLVDRSSNANRAKSLEILKKTLDQNISILIFPEGTFNETGHPLKKFYDGAFRIAIETNTPIKPTVYLDAIKLMHFSSPLRLKPGVSRVVILPEIPVNGFTIHNLEPLKQQVYTAMEAAILKYR
ncbi:MAG: lysophospholipid acyltransferase family protein [Bacteroidota bacterium]